MAKTMEKEKEEVTESSGPLVSAVDFNTNDIPAISQIFELAKKAAIENDDVLMQIVAYKQQFLAKLNANIPQDNEREMDKVAESK